MLTAKFTATIAGKSPRKIGGGNYSRRRSKLEHITDTLIHTRNWHPSMRVTDDDAPGWVGGMNRATICVSEAVRSTK